MLGHCRLRYAGASSQRAHVLFSVAGQVLEDRATSGIGESSENMVRCDLGLHGENHNHTVIGCQEQICEGCELFCGSRRQMRPRPPFMQWVSLRLRGWSQWVDATPSNMKLLFKGGVYDSRETGCAFCGAAERAMEPLEGGAVAARDRARL